MSFLPALCLAQLYYDTLWTKTYGGIDLDKGSSITLTHDGGYIIAGETRDFGPGPLAIYLLRTDSLGDTLWTQAYGGSAYDYALSVKETADSGYIIAGVTNSFGAGYRDLYLIKTDSIGDTTWTRTIGGSENDVGAAVLQTADGGYIITGTTYSYSAGSGDVWIVKTDANGGFVWNQNYGGADSDAGWDIKPTSDGGYIITGQTRSYGAGDFDVYLLKTDSLGDTLWTRTYGGVGEDRGYSVLAHAGGYTIAGYTVSFGGGGDDVFLVRTDLNGDTLWTRTFGGAYDDRARSVCVNEGGEYFVIGSTNSTGAGGADLYMLWLLSDGSLILASTYGGIADDEGLSVQCGGLPEQGFVVTGYTESFGAGIEDVWLLKFGVCGGIADTKTKAVKYDSFLPTIFSSRIQLPKGVAYKFYDIMGRDIDATRISPGVYFLEVEGIIIQKIIKIR
jgi:hypothetical protein